MSLFDELKEKFLNKNKKGSGKSSPKNMEIKIDIKTLSLKRNVEFILFNLPKNLIGGIEIIEDVFEGEETQNRIIVYATMNSIDIKRKIGRFIFDNKRWEVQEDMARKLFAEEKIDLDMFYEAYDTKDYLTVYKNVCLDIFAVYYGNEEMSLDEVALAINGLYIKNITDKKIEKESEDLLENLVDSLFDEKN